MKHHSICSIMPLRLLIFMLAMLPCGCSKEKTETGTPASPAETKAAESRAQSLVIWYAQFDPGSGVHKMGEQFEKETGIPTKVHLIPWQSYQNDVFLNFGKEQTDFDIVVGDSQWLGKGATSGWYLELTDWLPTVVKIEDIHPTVVKYVCEYPPDSKKLYAAPCEAEGMGVAYRRDWFEDPKEKEAFRAKYERDLNPPQTWEELRDLATFFQRPEQQRYGFIQPTGRGYDALVMSYQPYLWAFGGAWADPVTGMVQGRLNGPEALAGLEFMKSLVSQGPPNAANLDYPQVIDTFKSGIVAMAEQYFAWFPKLVDEMGNKVGFLMLPTRGQTRAVSLGGQGLSISSKISQERQETAKQFIAWFLKPENQRRWVSIPACFSSDINILKDEEFRRAAPYHAPLADTFDYMKDFWNIPEYAELLSVAQKYLGQAIDGALEPKAALDAMAAEHEAILKRAGQIK